MREQPAPAVAMGIQLDRGEAQPAEYLRRPRPIGLAPAPSDPAPPRAAPCRPWWRTRRSPLTPTPGDTPRPASTCRSRSGVIARPYSTRLERQGAAGASQVGRPSFARPRARRAWSIPARPAASAPLFAAGTQPGPVFAQIIGVGPVDDGVEAALLRHLPQPGPQLGFAEIAALGGVAQIVGIVELVGVDLQQRNARIAGPARARSRYWSSG